MDRIEIIYATLDDMAQAILHNRIPLSDKVPDPNSKFGMEPATWPDTYLRWKESVKEREEHWGRQLPLTGLQWQAIELYLKSQYGLELPNE